jgi:hypothetical protein
VPGYCGKNGKSHTEAEYRTERIWERTLLISWPLGIVAGIYLSRKKTLSVKNDG